jgi:hypothetical protein
VVKPKTNGLPFKTAKSTATDFPFKIFIYGDPGSGKTFSSVTAPAPMVLLTERNGLHSIRQSNPDALVKYCEDADDIRDVLKLALNGELEAHGVKTLVVDSLTEVQRMFADEIMRKKGASDEQRMSLPDWGLLTEKMRKFMRCLRDLDLHVVATALSDTATDESTGHIKHFPSFAGRKLSSEVSQFFNVVGYCFKREHPELKHDNGSPVIEHLVMLEGPSRFVCKPCGPVTGIRTATIGEWYQDIENFTGGSANGAN